jgi:iron complex outermembrane receptor protein
MKKYNRLARAIGKATCYSALLLFGLMLLGNPVLAQDVSSSEKEESVLEEITVTGSRIRTSGMETPTPVTVVVPEEIELTAPTTMIEGLAQLPQFYGSATTQNTGGFFTSQGAGSLNLRGLQSKRTLQLLDGRRVVPSTIFGGPDINLFPELLLRTVETVTGGASAAYGTDAVAGVVNFLLNTEYQGIKGHVQMGETERGHNKNQELEIAAGFALTDNTHVLFSAEKSVQDPIWGQQLHEYEWYDSIGLVKNPSATAGTSPDNPYYIPVAKLYSTTGSLDGILLFTPAQGGQYTFDSAGNAVPYVNSTGLCTSNGQLCATPNANASAIDIAPYDATQITPDTGRENFFGYIKHEFSDNLKVFAQAIYGKTYFINKNLPGVFTSGWGAFTIYRENPFLPQNIKDLMVARGLTNVKFARLGSPDDIGFDAYTEQKTKSLSLTTGFEYDVDSGFFNDWQVKGYYQYGNTNVKAIQRGGIRLDRIYLAMDVVTDPLTGQPACNVKVTTRGTANEMYQDCVPLNLFGRGNASPEAVDWVVGFEPGVLIDANGVIGNETMPYSYISGENKQRIIDIDQTVFEVSADGEIFDGWGAGPIEMAIGYNYREESFTQVVEVGPGGNINADPKYRPVMATNAALGIRGVASGNVASGNLVEMQFSNVPFARGDQNVHEIFDELLVPIISDLPFVKQLNFNGAARWAKYSGAGKQWSWKGGLDWAVYKDLRLRSTISQDVRAATMGEKFDRTGGLANIVDYLWDPNGSKTYSITMFSNGSPDIQPEKAKTSTVGLVYQPGWLPGLSFATDWYNVEVKDNIQAMTAAEVVRKCYQENDPQLCNLITRGGADEVTIPGGNPITRITLVGTPYVNQASVKAVGVDFEIGYRTHVDLLGGGESINVRLIGSYVGENSSTNVAGVTTETVGITYPKWVANLLFTYQRGLFGFSFQNRYTSKTLIYRNWNYSGTSTRWDVYDNTVDPTILTDAQVNYGFDLYGVNLNLYLNVNNLFDNTPQPYLAGNAGGGDNNSIWGSGPGLGVTGDLRGRRFVFGVRYEFE